jgi:hypothetical protein
LVGLGLSIEATGAPFLLSTTIPSGAVKTAADRAAEAIEAAETMFAEEMGATLDLSPAAKIALIVKVASAIEAAVAEERQEVT